MSRKAAAREIQDLLEQLHKLAVQGERLAVASGGLVEATPFRAIQSAVSISAGELDQHGFLDRKVAP